MTTLIIGLVMAALIFVGGVYAFLASQALLTDNRERRRYRAIIDEDRAREVRLQTEMADLEVAEAMSGLDDELNDLLSQGL